MKKFLLTLSVAALAMTACTNESEEIINNSPQPKEIALKAYAQPTTRAAVDGETFPTASSMQVAAYDVTNNRDFFGATTFNWSNSGTIWTGSKYWPLTPTYINFLAYAELNDIEGSSATWDITNDEISQKANGVVLVMANNSSAQKDLMYAIGNGAVTQDGNTLTFPPNVPMVFKHAQAWISFYADAYDATSGGKITLNSITLNGAKYAGTYTVTHTNYNASSGQNVSGAWSDLGDAQNVVVPNWTADAIAYNSSGNGVPVGDGLLIVPDDNAATADFTSFTINYTLDDNTYTYTYAPTSRNVDQAKHYIYNINFHLHEILISATVTDWADQDAVPVTVHPEEQDYLKPSGVRLPTWFQRKKNKQMKYYNWHKWYIFLLAAGLLTGCSADEPETPVKDDSQKEIKFQVTSASSTNATRALIFDSNSDLQSHDIHIDAYYNATNTKYLDGARLKYNSTYTKWLFYSSDWTNYYWPIPGSVLTSSSITVSSLDFVGYVPYTQPSCIGEITYSVDNGLSFPATLPITSGSPNTFNETNQTSLQEFMYAYEGNQTKDSNSGTVNLQFQHPFALVYIYLGKAKRNTTINSVTLSGLKTEGTCTFNPNNTPATVWSSLDTEANLVKTVGKTVPGQLNFSALIGGPYFVIPQTLSGDKNLTVNRTYEDDTSDIYATLSTTWEPGKVYSYYLDLGEDLDVILINVTIEEWATYNYKTPIDIKQPYEEI